MLNHPNSQNQVNFGFGCDSLASLSGVPNVGGGGNQLKRTPKLWCILLGCSVFNFCQPMGLPTKSYSLLAGEQKATEKTSNTESRGAGRRAAPTSSAAGLPSPRATSGGSPRTCGAPGPTTWSVRQTTRLVQTSIRVEMNICLCFILLVV